MMNNDFLTMRDSKRIYYQLWNDCKQINEWVLIVHGMAEYIARYDDFARYLNSNGIGVIGMDLRSHGQTDPDKLGGGYKTLFEDTVDDIFEFVNFIKDSFGKTPVLIGHSYGSFLLQRYLQKHPQSVSKSILSASALMGGITLKTALILSKIKNKNPDANGELFAKMTFKKYDKKIKGSKNSWLSRDAQVAEKYNNDPFCGFICSNGFYYSFFNGLKAIAKNNKRQNLKNCRILIASGSKDAVGNYGVLAKKLFKTYQKTGADVSLKLYQDARHEILNELNKSEVYEDFKNFIL